MDTISLKKYIFKHNKIEYVLEKIGCQNIKYHEKRNYYSATQADGDNPQGVNIRNNEYLNYRSHSRDISYDDNQDLITLVENTKKISFIKAIKYLHKILNLDYQYKKVIKKEKIEPTSLLEICEKNPSYVFARHKFKCRTSVDVSDLPVLDDGILDEYVPLLYIGWFREGIMPWTAKKFGLAYSYKQKRVIIPMKYWFTGELLGINSRTTIENYKELGIKKFFITPSYPKNINLFGLYENLNSIQKAGYVVVYESEKSVLKRDSLGDSTGVALSGHSISEEQIRILMGLNVEIIISLDKDIDINEVRHICHKFFKARKTSYTWDKYDLIGEKDSIADANNKIFNYLLKHRITYDTKEDNEYKKSLKKKNKSVK